MRLGHGLSVLLGGARSGKSDLAVQLGRAWSGQVTFVATATAGDDDMATRIARHRQERPHDWHLVESPCFEAADIALIAGGDLIIVDCLTLLVANLVFDGRREDRIIDQVEQLSSALAARAAPSLVISNEVGLGVHPETALGRAYRDLLGRANRTIAATAQTSMFVIAGKVVPLQDLEITWQPD